MFLFWFFGMTVVNKGASHFHTLDLTHCVYVILHSSSSLPTSNSLVASFGVSVTSCLDYCNSFLGVSLSLSLPHHYPSPKAIWLWNLLTLKTCSLFPHDLVAILLRKTQKALHSRNPTFLFCFYQSTHITYLLVALELFHCPLTLLDLSGLSVFFAFAQAIPSAWDAFLAFLYAKLPCSFEIQITPQFTDGIFPAILPSFFTVSVSSSLPNHIIYSFIITVSSLC